MADKKKISITIKSDGTRAGTSLLVNGADITKDKNVTHMYLSAWGSDGISLSWTTSQKDEKGIRSDTSYHYDSNADSIERSYPRKFIGQDALLQFETVEDATSYKVYKKSKKLEDNIEIVDTKNEEK